MPNRFTPKGPLALEPQAFGFLLPTPMNLAVARRDNVAVVPVRGPMMQHSDPFADSYEALRGRVAEALDPKPAAVLLQVDSPGGVVAGAFETATQIREMCDEAGVPLHAYVEGQATSAGYALACVAQHVMVSSTGMVGSIGVINALVDTTAADEAMGVRFTMITSGARKADTNPHVSTTDDAVTAAQQIVSGMAAVFYAHVARFRDLDVGTIEALQAGLFFGNGAVTLGLADGVGSFNDALAMAADARTAAVVSPQATENPNMGKPMEDALTALRKAAEGDNEEEAKKARAALAALEDEERDEEATDDEGEEAKATEEREDEEAKATDDEDEEAKAEVPAAPPSAIAATTGNAELESRVLSAEKRALLATSRPGASDELVAAVMAPDVSVATAQLMISAVPKTPRVPVADVTPAATRGASQGGPADGPTNLSPEAAEMDRRFGLTDAHTGGVTRDKHSVTFSTMTREAARAASAKNGAQ